MQTRLIIFLLTCSLMFMAVVWHLVNRGRLRPRHALLWLITSVDFFLLLVLRGASRDIADFFQVDYAPSFYFAVAILFILLILLNQTLIISNISRQSKELAQRYALQEWRLSELEKILEQNTILEADTQIASILNFQVDERTMDARVVDGIESHE